MKSTYLYLSLALLTLGFLTSCGPDAIKSQPKEVTSLTLNKTSETLYLGETLELSATVTPADAEVTFKTDNAAVATVCKKGVVKAIAPGTATITAQAGNKQLPAPSRSLRLRGQMYLYSTSSMARSTPREARLIM